MESTTEQDDIKLKQRSYPLENKQSEKSYVPYHPGLSSLAQAQDDYTKVFSDHVPILSTIPLERELPVDDSKETKERGLTADDSKDTKHRNSISILSWNVLQDDRYGGFAPLNKREFEESVQQKEARHARIADGLEKMVREHHPQFIALQEIYGPQTSVGQSNTDDEFELYQKIQEKLGQNYQAVSVRGDVIGGKEGCITFYDATQFEIQCFPGPKYNALGGYATLFQSKEEGDTLKVSLLNIHSAPSYLPDYYETPINQFLEEVRDPTTVSIVAGDFNCHIAPHSKPQNIITSAASHRFRDNKLQGAAAVDGCFYSSYSQQEYIRSHHRADTVRLDPSTGRMHEASALQPIDVESLPELQRNEITKYRMMISVDDYYRDRRIIDSKYRILEYEQRLRWQFSDNGILVRPASNLNNHEKMGLLLSKNLCQCIQLIDNQKFQFQQDRDILDEFQHYIYLDRVHTGELLTLTDKIATNTNLIRLSANIVKLKENTQIDRNIVGRFEALLRTLVSQPIPLNESIIPIIIDHFIHESEAIARNPNRSVDEINRSAAKLDARLLGKPPMSMSLKSVICSLIAACLGAVVGVVFSALTSMDWDGGFAAFAESVVDKFEVSEVGLNTGIAIAGVVGGIAGFFSGKRNAREYGDKKYEVERLDNKEVLTSFGEVNTAIKEM